MFWLTLWLERIDVTLAILKDEVRVMWLKGSIAIAVTLMYFIDI